MKRTLLLFFPLLSFAGFGQSLKPAEEKAVSSSVCGMVATDTFKNTPIFLRCGGSPLRRGNEPLVVADGIVLQKGGLAAINPNDVESISILKGSEAIAVYGSQGVNGVIVVRTKTTRQLTLVDESDSLPLNGATVAFFSGTQKRVYVSNKAGIAAVPLSVIQSADTLRVSCIGYESLQTPFVTTAQTTLRLRRKVNKLEPVTIASTSRWISCRLFCRTRIIRVHESQLTKKPASQNNFSVYPNPAAKASVLTVVLPEVAVQTYTVLTIAGRVIQAGNIPSEAAKTFTLSTGNWPSGTYLMRLIGNEGRQVFTQKIIIQ